MPYFLNLFLYPTAPLFSYLFSKNCSRTVRYFSLFFQQVCYFSAYCFSQIPASSHLASFSLRTCTPDFWRPIGNFKLFPRCAPEIFWVAPDDTGSISWVGWSYWSTSVTRSSAWGRRKTRWMRCGPKAGIERRCGSVCAFWWWCSIVIADRVGCGSRVWREMGSFVLTIMKINRYYIWPSIYLYLYFLKHKV